MDWVTIVNGLFGVGGLAVVIIKLIEIYSSRTSRMADAAKTIAEGGAEAVKAVRELLADYDKIMDKQRAEIASLEAWKKERERLGRERDAEFADLKQKYEDLEAQNIQITNRARETDLKVQKDTEETQRLRADYALVQRDNIRLYEVTIGLASAVEAIKKAVQDAGIPLPINGEVNRLLESVYRLKTEREQRGKP